MNTLINKIQVKNRCGFPTPGDSGAAGVARVGYLSSSAALPTPPREPVHVTGSQLGSVTCGGTWGHCQNTGDIINSGWGQEFQRMGTFRWPAQRAAVRPLLLLFFLSSSSVLEYLWSVRNSPPCP